MRGITILTNGPGELWGWVRPLSAELGRRGHSVTVRLLPCPYATGEEGRMAATLGVSRVIGPLSSGRTAVSVLSRDRETGLVFQLGGDLLWGRMLAAANAVPLLCYSYGRKRGLHRCNGVFTAFPSMAVGMEGAVPVGDLVADSLKMSVQTSLSVIPEERKGPRVVFFPGSRESIRRFARPFLRKMVLLLRKEYPDLVGNVLLSPFAPAGEDENWRSEGFLPVRGSPADVLRGADFAVTQPGTNTLELMHLAVPFLAVVPFSALRKAPLSGLAGMLARTPILGPALRERVLRGKGLRAGFLSWPNRIAGRPVVDELFGDVSPEDAARTVAGRLGDRKYLEGTRAALAALSSSVPGGAACALADAAERMM